MEYWEFLIQREGDRGWRSIKTGNLQLMEGKYRIVANSNLLDTQIQTRITHQTLGETVPQRRSKSSTQSTNPRGLLVILPFTQIQSGIWQFVCSGETETQAGWHQILKLRVLPRIPTQALVDNLSPLQLEIPTTVALIESQPIDRLETPIYIVAATPVCSSSDLDDLPTPTAPLVPISRSGEQENWADGLDRLLAQLERDSLCPQPPQPKVRDTFPQIIQLQAIVDPPLQLIKLDRSTFSSISPGDLLKIDGACNLRLLKPNLVRAVKIEKLSICLRHPQTAEIVVSIERSLPPNLDTFSFCSQLKLPVEPKIGLLLGEVNLYDKHNIQLGSSGFTVALSLNPQHESELSLQQFLDRSKDEIEVVLTQIAQELQLTPAIVGSATITKPLDTNEKNSPSFVRLTTSTTLKPLNSPQRSPVPLTYKHESLFTHPDIVPIEPTEPLTLDITGDLELDFGASPDEHHRYDIQNYQNLEIVVDGE